MGVSAESAWDSRVSFEFPKAPGGNICRTPDRQWHPTFSVRGDGTKMSERSECRYASIDLYEQAKKQNFEGPGAILALAAANYEIAAAHWEMYDFLSWAADRYLEVKEQKGASKGRGRKK